MHRFYFFFSKPWTPLAMLFACTLMFAPAWCAAYEKISVQALFKGKAIIVVDGARRVLAAGEESAEGVKLVEVDTRAETATIEFEGRTRILSLGAVMSAGSGGGGGGKGIATLFAEPNGHFHADGFINDSPVRFLVDTGATTIAISGAMAGRLDIEYRRIGKAGMAATAGGMVRTYTLKLAKVQVGDITLHNVDAGVLEGNFPIEPLLGMSFLGQLDMKRESDRMELRQR